MADAAAHTTVYPAAAISSCPDGHAVRSTSRAYYDFVLPGIAGETSGSERRHGTKCSQSVIPPAG